MEMWSSMLSNHIIPGILEWNFINRLSHWYMSLLRVNPWPHLRVWGCRAVVKVPEHEGKKLDESGVECVFIGYAHHNRTYRFIIAEPDAIIVVNIVIESRDAIFDETRILRFVKIMNKESIRNLVLKSNLLLVILVIQKCKQKLLKLGEVNLLEYPRLVDWIFMFFFLEGTNEQIVHNYQLQWLLNPILILSRRPCHLKMGPLEGIY
jgi:hypothetical protein